MNNNLISSEECFACQAKCCKSGTLPLLEKERAMFSQSRLDANGNYDLTGDCEFLDKKTYACRIYLVRPEKCREFPFIHKESNIFVMSFCPIAEAKIKVTKLKFRVI